MFIHKAMWAPYCHFSQTDPTHRDYCDVDKFVDAIFDFYKDLTPDELVDRRESGRTREKITYKKKVKETRNKYIKEVA